MIRNLAIKGGGIKGIAYVGAIQELDAAKHFKGIQRVAGTSAGALMACMIACGYTSAQIEELMFSLDFKKLASGSNPLRIIKSYGVHSGGYLLSFIEHVVEKSPHGLLATSTFADMHKAGCRELYVFAMDINAQNIVEFSYTNTPDVCVAEAIRASMSIPMYYQAWKFSNDKPNNHIYVDGGVAFNYPLDFFDHPKFNSNPDLPNEESVGLFLRSKNPQAPSDLGYYSPMEYVKQLFEAFMDAQDIEDMEDTVHGSKTIFIDDFNMSGTDFNLTHAQVLQLIESGRKATKEFLQSYKVEKLLVNN
jgi:NTE family protein